MDQYIGKLLDNRYEILEVIGTGGMAVVYKARCNRLNRLVAIKALKQELSQDEEFRRRFYAESQAVAMLSHPNIVSVYDVAHSDGLDYIVMELIDGITLKQYMEQKGQLNWREALHFATQIAKALEHAHSRGIVHRDIKPHNIMILKDGSVKVADFGIARISSAQNTLTREALGSVHYISPEQAKGAHVDARSDLYSLGVVMYEMLTGRPPFDGDTPVSVAIQHINATPVLPRELNPNIPLGLEQITMHAMTADLNKRYKSATEMLADLEEFRKDPNTTFDFTHRQGGIDMERLLHDPDYLPKSLGVSAAKNRAKKAIAGKKQEREAPKAQNAPKADAPEKRGSRIAVIAGIVCIALALCGIGYFLYSYLSDLFATTKEDVVPSFVGAYYEDIDASQYPNFKIEVGDWRTSDSVEYGRVISQTPDAERTVKVGTTILLTVSSGVSSDTMPPLVNQTVQAAQTALNALNMQVTVNIEYETSTTFTDGYVMATDPAAGETLTAGQTVTLTVCAGAGVELVKVPALQGETVDEAIADIKDAGLEPGQVRYVESDLPKDTVTYQSVDAGEQVKAGTVINLQASKGPEQARTPFVRSVSQDAEVGLNEELTLRVEAETSDNGTLSYAWYVSENGSVDGASLVSRSAEDNDSCIVDTSRTGTFYYFCKITNTLGDATESVNSPMIEVVVGPSNDTVDKVIYVTMPSDGRTHTVTVYVAGVQQMEPFEVEAGGVQIPIQVSGSGEQNVDIYLDGSLYDSQLVDFTTVG